MRSKVQNRFLPRRHSLILIWIAWRIFMSSVSAVFSPTNKMNFICSKESVQIKKMLQKRTFIHSSAGQRTFTWIYLVVFVEDTVSQDFYWSPVNQKLIIEYFSIQTNEGVCRKVTLRYGVKILWQTPFKVAVSIDFLPFFAMKLSHLGPW